MSSGWARIRAKTGPRWARIGAKRRLVVEKMLGTTLDTTDPGPGEEGEGMVNPPPLDVRSKEILEIFEERRSWEYSKL